MPVATGNPQYLIKGQVIIRVIGISCITTAIPEQPGYFQISFRYTYDP
jgi:hypothetical protein